MHTFCTLFDINYLTRGLVLHRSLERTGVDFSLSVYCMDLETERVLRKLDLPRLTIVPLAELEAHNTELLAVKPTRTQVEYCWTATPAVCLHALQTQPGIDSITYVDADLMFFADPQPVYDELGDDSVLIIPHRYAERWRYQEPTSGIYNVQFMTFRRDGRGLGALQWWHDRCIEWCYYRVEDGKLGDQKYLDDWPERFEGVHVLEHPGGGLAPWNVERYVLERRGDTTYVDGRPLVFYHYHSLRLYRGVTLMRSLGLLSSRYHLTRAPVPLVWTENYPMSEDERRLIWEPYLAELGRAYVKTRLRDPRFNAGFVPVDARAIAREFAGRGMRRSIGIARSLAARALRARRRRQQSDHRESWKDPDVARQMEELVTGELEHPDGVPPYRAFIEAIDELLRENDLPDPAQILDFGCGVGHYSELLSRRFPGRFAYTGCDYSPAMVDVARSRWPDRQFVVNDLFANQLPLETFDVVFAGALVDVVPDYEAALDVLLGGGSRYVVLHRQQLADGSSHVDVVGGYENQTTYRSFVTRTDLERIAARNGRRVMAEFEVDGPLRTFVFAQEPE
jgi:SAM-dependent methyltransferase